MRTTGQALKADANYPAEGHILFLWYPSFVTSVFGFNIFFFEGWIVCTSFVPVVQNSTRSYYGNKSNVILHILINGRYSSGGWFRLGEYNIYRSLHTHTTLYTWLEQIWAYYGYVCLFFFLPCVRLCLIFTLCERREPDVRWQIVDNIKDQY